MLDANSLAAMWIGPAGDVTGGVNVFHIRLEELVHRNSAVHRKTRLLGQRQSRLHSDANDDQVRVHPRAVVERDRVPVDALWLSPKTEMNALFFVERLD